MQFRFNHHEIICSYLIKFFNLNLYLYFYCIDNPAKFLAINLQQILILNYLIINSAIYFIFLEIYHNNCEQEIQIIHYQTYLSHY